jgi:hypothetical protein
MARKHIAEIRAAFPRLMRLMLEPFEFGEPASNFEVSSALTAVA